MKLILLLLAIAISLVPRLLPDTSSTVYTSQEITVPFPSDGYEVMALRPMRSDDGYFGQVQTHIKFCAQPDLPADVQQVTSEDGWLCEFEQLPVISKDKARQAIMGKYQRQEGGHHGLVDESEIQEMTINGQQVLYWRWQAGKSRMDHYLLFGKEANYHFTSSPYGDGYLIEEILEGVELK